MKLQPVALNERIEAIDLMRGFSLLGILLINMLAFHSPFSYIDPYTWFDGPFDTEVFGFIDIFIQGSFYPLFSMLFGYGLAMQYMKAQERQQPFLPVAIKRLLILLGFGILHAFLIWYGDILITYAVTGFFLLALLRLSPAWLLALGAAIYTLPHAFLLGLMFIAVSIDPNIYTGIQEVQSSLAAYPTGTFADIFSQRFSDWMHSNNPSGYLYLIVTILPFLMVGAAAAKVRLIERAGLFHKSWINAAAGLLIIGLLLKAAPLLIDNNYAFRYIQDIFGGPLVAMGYAALIVLIADSRRMRKVLSPIAKVGRMSLTTYLSQSIIATFIFYSYGLGLYGQVDVLTGTWIALGIFAIQLIFAELWLSKYGQGPLEYLSRRMTYGRNLEKSNNSKR
ncbi:DUF418 domain-containing protein [Planococcus shenhongbingii]|uniref:DUF418 domain-containing protein n=1 Tax=Planococcus shenhongbingii TaxID=3058398 RepID=A0ABT8N970_9BACL|nr:DUF418 domain-containing protein [Planococcus sp. N017]MDN7244424.1 DUF418 domain-containing protein [Planococcus sp. N017]